ncbi:MAG: hypothetical protein M1816_003111 [Peltula sp. TS41687]|nr:MAG: hypothetical protein M1816_003111 [Peltula sp. TS41687]
MLRVSSKAIRPLIIVKNDRRFVIPNPNALLPTSTLGPAFLSGTLGSTSDLVDYGGAQDVLIGCIPVQWKVIGKSVTRPAGIGIGLVSRLIGNEPGDDVVVLDRVEVEQGGGVLEIGTAPEPAFQSSFVDEVSPSEYVFIEKEDVGLWGGAECPNEYIFMEKEDVGRKRMSPELGRDNDNVNNKRVSKRQPTSNKQQARKSTR